MSPTRAAATATRGRAGTGPAAGTAAHPAAPAAPHVVVRDAAADDALGLSVLAMQVFLDTYATQGIRPTIAREAMALSATSFLQFIEEPPARLQLAECDGHLIGFFQLRLATAHPLLADAGQAELQRLYVQRPFIGQGVGLRLLRCAEALAAHAGAGTLWLTAWAHNHRALAFYARQGYCDHGLAWYTFENESHENRVLARRLAATATGQRAP